MIRTYYWHDRVVGCWAHSLRRLMKRNPYYYFLIGNAGDIFVKDLIETKYKTRSVNIYNEGNRLLLIGSIAHKISHGDIICGIGAKTPNLPKAETNRDALIYGLRGPMSYDAFRHAGFDLSHVKFLLDPGLLIRYFLDTTHLPENGKIGFIPHYREREFYWKNPPKNISLIDIDNFPVKVAEEILSCELVYSSSLHGIIFSHALGRPCIFVAPRTEEPIFKYEDYYASVNLPMPIPLTEPKTDLYITKPLSPPNLQFKQEDFQFPSVELLRDKGVMMNDYNR